MPTNEERREVAENLRTMMMRGCRYKEEFYDLLNETVMNEWDFHSFSDVADRLADLIEPEPERTCHAIQHENGRWYLGCCGHWCDEGWYVNAPNFCERCGAKVVE